MKGTVVLHDVAKILVPWLIKLFTEHPEDQAQFIFSHLLHIILNYNWY